MEKLEDSRILEQYETLPDDLKEILSSSDATALIFYIVAGRGFSDDQANSAALLTSRVLLGFLAPRDFISSLAEELQIDYETAKQIALEINEQVFLPVRDSLRKIHNLTEAGPEAVEEAALPEEPAPVE